jgi:hypothetical protein
MKPQVTYSQITSGPVVGARANVFITSPHPVLGLVAEPKWVHTSMVVAVEESGNFETLNTYYVKAAS